jgi:hypothetical protein
MRSWAWRQWGLGALDFCSGPAHTRIVHTTIMAFHPDCQRGEARRETLGSTPTTCPADLPRQGIVPRSGPSITVAG